MKNKKVVVTLKYYKGELNPFDAAALEVALELGFTDITVLAMAPESVLPSLTALTRLGVNAVLITDPAYAGSDTIATSYILAEAIRTLSPDLIFSGRQSVDGDTAQVPPMIAQRLGFDISNKVIDLDPSGEFVTRSGERVDTSTKRVITFERMRSLRFPSMFSKPKEVKVITNADLMLDRGRVGLLGSPTRVIKAYESTVGRRFCRFVDKSELDSLIADAIGRDTEQELSEYTEKFDKVYYLGNLDSLAENIASCAIRVPYVGKTANEIADYLRSMGARTVLFEGNDTLKELAARVAVICDAGLCADCISFRSDNGRFVMTRPAGGGNITADIVCVSEMSFATVKTADRSGSSVIFSIGKGAVPYVDKIKDMAKKYDAEICSSRTVVDAGIMPYSSQVGLTGKSVAPAVYVCFGISGAVQHTVGISGAKTVIAINNDKGATVFDYADYGIVADINEL